jgi:hypothetical protein
VAVGSRGFYHCSLFAVVVGVELSLPLPASWVGLPSPVFDTAALRAIITFVAVKLLTLNARSDESVAHLVSVE